MKNLKKSLALILSLALIASLFVCLGAVTASAATEAEGKRDLDWDGTYWYSDTKVSTYTSGSGTADDPYIITTAAQLRHLVRGDLAGGGKYYKLGNDIVINDTSTANWYEGTNLKNWIKGTDTTYGTFSDARNVRELGGNLFRDNFDGAGYTIYGLYIDYTGTGTMTGSNSSRVYCGWGLFPYVMGATFKNVKLKDVYIKSNITGNKNAEYHGYGALVGNVHGDVATTFENVQVENVHFDIARPNLSTAGKPVGVGGIIGYSTGNLNVKDAVVKNVTASFRNYYATSRCVGYAGAIFGAIGWGKTATLTNVLTVGAMNPVSVVSMTSGGAVYIASGNATGNLQGNLSPVFNTTNCYSIGAEQALANSNIIKVADEETFVNGNLDDFYANIGTSTNWSDKAAGKLPALKAYDTSCTHVYDDNCVDTECNECGEVRDGLPGHTYDGDCDTACNECGATREAVGDHVDTNKNYSCDNCGISLVPAESRGGVSQLIYGNGNMVAGGASGISYGSELYALSSYNSDNRILTVVAANNENEIYVADGINAMYLTFHANGGAALTNSAGAKVTYIIKYKVTEIGEGGYAQIGVGNAVQNNNTAWTKTDVYGVSEKHTEASDKEYSIVVTNPNVNTGMFERLVVAGAGSKIDVTYIGRFANWAPHTTKVTMNLPDGLKYAEGYAPGSGLGATLTVFGGAAQTARYFDKDGNELYVVEDKDMEVYVMLSGVCPHVYDNKCVDTDCNICGEAQEVVGHKYTADCDAICDLCNEVTREVEVEHTYDDASCDKWCNNCYTEREAGHVFDNECDADCNNGCGLVREGVGHIDEDEDDVCDTCGNEMPGVDLPDVPIDPHEHVAGDWEVVTEATVDADGLKARKCECGEVMEEKVIPRILNFRNKTLALQSNISIIFRVDPVYFTTHGYSNPVVIFTLNGVEYPVSEYNVNKTSGLYEFAFNGVAPHQMKDMVSAVFTAEYEGEVYTSAAQEYSIFTYCNNQITKNYTNTNYAKLMGLLVDILNYGAAAQNYKNYNTADLANGNLTAAQKALGNQDVISYADEKQLKNDVVEGGLADIKVAGLTLQDSVIMTFKFELLNGATLDGLTAHVTAAGKSWDIDASEFTYEASTGRYIISFNGLNPAQMREAVTINLQKDGAVVSDTATYSVESYGLSTAAQGSANLAALVEAMARYGRSAKAYNG